MDRDYTAKRNGGAMSRHAYDKELTALLVIDPCNEIMQGELP